jgi:uncharacterized protein with ParB-like and HNH nuclease domain
LPPSPRYEAQPNDEKEPLDGFSPKKLRNRHLVNADEEGERFHKLLLSQGDKETLKAILKQAEPPAPASERVKANFEFINTRLAKPGADLARVCRGLAKLTVVDIRLDRTHDNPQLIFESMNSTGRRLSQADLIRNYVQMGLEPSLQDHLYAKYWRPMETDFGQAVYEEQFDEFVRHFLTVLTGEIPRLGDIYEAGRRYSQCVLSVTRQAVGLLRRRERRLMAMVTKPIRYTAENRLIVAANQKA